MALTFTKSASGVMGDKRYWYGLVTFDNSYPTGGETITAADFEMTNLQVVYPSGTTVATKRVAWAFTTGKLMIFVEDGTSGIEAQAGSTSDQSAVVVPVLALGE